MEFDISVIRKAFLPLFSICSTPERARKVQSPKKESVAPWETSPKLWLFTSFKARTQNLLEEERFLHERISWATNPLASPCSVPEETLH